MRAKTLRSRFPPHPRPIGILGGTFDPIHDGHLRPALEVLEALDLAEIRFVPCRIPAHRDSPQITAEQRLALVRLATAGQAGFAVDDRELRREGASYMVDTLASLREDLGDIPLYLIVGADAFRELHTWHRWRELGQFAHVVVMQRPGPPKPFAPVLEEFVAPRMADAAALRRQPAGLILFQPVTQLDISATHIRALLARGQSPRFLLPEAVLACIHERALYRPLSTPASMT
ncbi:MAG: nicotinate-nucleotide adenylyltransferase [Candidatus Competibacter sp.]|nr:nicotinate-nucleotide adenylyltransferase [Candidatus Competibacter sp.]MDG4585790.1 nicotinate-nucleotide adenylyltransferase [Candidatus Competibacter sp.]